MNNLKPLSHRTLTRILIFLLIATALVTGLYRTKLILLQKEYDLVENRYVRVREMLGRDKTQDLINRSYQLQGIAPPKSVLPVSQTGTDSSALLEIDQKSEN